jgi:hypothetical protein
MTLRFRVRYRHLAVLPLLLLSLAPPREAAACSVCLAGDPLFSTHGANAQEAGSFSFYLEARSFRKTSGAHAHEDAGPAEPEDGEHGHGMEAESAHSHDHHAEGTEDSRGQRVDLYASWTPLDRWTFTLDVPFAWNRIIEDSDGERTRSSLSGLGDVSLGSSFVLWRNREVLPSTWIEGRLWLKAPTGRDETKVDGVRNPHLQPGTGSWDFGAGLAAVHRLSWGSLYASVFYRENTPGSLDYTFGDVWLANAAVEVPLGHAFGQPALEWLTAGLELNFRYAGYDRDDGENFENSGGAILYATPSVRIRLPFGLRESRASLRAAVQIPLSQTWLHNTQREKEVWSLGLLVPF